MFERFLNVIVFAGLLVCAAVAVRAQLPDIPDATSRSPRDRRGGGDMPLGLKEMLAKQRAERDKKDHEELLERGEEALKLAKQLENSFAENKGFSQQDRNRLDTLEKVVTKIRKGLGGDDDNESDGQNYAASVDEPKPSTLEEGFKYLQTTTVKLVDELKKTTRFSISAIAIQSSNTVLKLVRFLRLRK